VSPETVRRDADSDDTNEGSGMTTTTDRPIRLMAQPPTALLVAWRCPSCNALLAKIHLTAGSVLEIKCARCNTIATKEAA
jgi:hypothetical protein